MTAATVESKVCEHCRGRFYRGRQVSDVNWARRKYCRDACTVAGGRARREAQAQARAHAVQILGVLAQDRQWRSRAACLDVDSELFFPLSDNESTNREQIVAAKAVCRRCPVVTECLAGAVAAGDNWAIRGGTTPAERRAMRPGS